MVVWLWGRSGVGVLGNEDLLLSLQGSRDSSRYSLEEGETQSNNSSKDNHNINNSCSNMRTNGSINENIVAIKNQQHQYLITTKNTGGSYTISKTETQTTAVETAEDNSDSYNIQ